MSVSYDFSGKVVLITGSSSGIGAETATLFAKSGAHVVVTGLKAKDCERVAKQCQSVSPKGLQPLTVEADVSREKEMTRLVDQTIKKFGKLDVLVNNAGYLEIGGVTDGDYMQVYRRIMNTNLTSVVFMTHICAQHLAKTKGNIINTSSIAAFIVSENNSAYCMSKTSINMFTKCMAIELGEMGIRVNCVSPGSIRTTILETMGVSKSDSDKFWDENGLRYPVKRAGEPRDIANAILFLASDHSAFTTGTVMLVDGGHVAASVGFKPEFNINKTTMQ